MIEGSVVNPYLGGKWFTELYGLNPTTFYQEVLESQVTQERFATAAVLANPDDRVAVRAWLGLHGSDPRQASQRSSEAYSSLPLPIRGSELLERLASGEIACNGSGSTLIRARARLFLGWREYMENHTLNELLERMFDSSIAIATEDDPERRRWIANDILTLRNAALSLLDKGETSLGEVVTTLRYRIATRLPLTLTEENPRVRIMTLHSAKGLEADSIILAGIADQMIPGITQTQSELDEQARLLYVAATRARNKLTISWPRSVSYADAQSNYIRSDTVRTIRGERIVVLSRTRFLPQALTGIRRGNQWLADEGVQY